MSFILKTILLFLKTTSAFIESVQSILQSICDVTESTLNTRLSAALVKDKSTQSNCQATQNYYDISNAEPSILIFNLKQNQKVTITYEDTDNSLTVLPSTKYKTSKDQPITNKGDRCDTSKPPSENVNIHWDSRPDASNLRSNAIHEVEDSKIQIETMGKSTTSEDEETREERSLNQMRKTGKRVKSFGCSFDKETGGLRVMLPSSNLCRVCGDFLRPTKSLDAIRTLNGKPLRELRRTAGIKRKHLKNNLDDCIQASTSEESKTVVPYIPLKRLNLEKTVLDSNTSTYRNQEHITSLQSKPLTEIPSHKIDSCNGVKSNSTCIDSLCSANICQAVICKNELGMSSTPSEEFEGHSTSEMDSHNVKIKSSGLLKDLPLASTHDHASREARNFFSTRKRNMVRPSKVNTTTCWQIKEIVRTLMREHFEMEHRCDPGKMEKMSGTETERSGGEKKYQEAITACKEQTKVKIIEEDNNSELEILNGSEEEYVKQELEKLSKIAVENEQIFENLRKTEEEGKIFCRAVERAPEGAVERAPEEAVERAPEEAVN